MKSMQYLILSMLIFILNTNKVIGQDEKFELVKDPAELIKNINQSSVETKTIRSEFSQIKRLEFLEEDVESSGKFYFRSSNLLRWEYTEPFKYIIIFKEDKILVGSNDKAKSYNISGNKMFEEISQIMLGIVNGTILESESFQVEYLAGQNNYLLKLTPQVAGINDFLNEIHLFLDKKDYTVDKLIMMEKSGDFTKIIFHNKVLNEDLQDNIFNIN